MYVGNQNGVALHVRDSDEHSLRHELTELCQQVRAKDDRVAGLEEELRSANATIRTFERGEYVNELVQQNTWKTARLVKLEHFFACLRLRCIYSVRRDALGLRERPVESSVQRAANDLVHKADCLEDAQLSGRRPAPYDQVPFLALGRGEHRNTFERMYGFRPV